MDRAMLCDEPVFDNGIGFDSACLGPFFDVFLLIINELFEIWRLFCKFFIGLYRSVLSFSV